MTNREQELEQLKVYRDVLQGRLQKLAEELTRLFKLTHDDKAILGCSRILLEILLKELCKDCKLNCESNMMVGTILDKFREKTNKIVPDIIPDDIHRSMKHINDLASAGAHDKPYDPKQVREVLVALERVLHWYVVAYKKWELPQSMSSDRPTADHPLLLGILVDVSGSMFIRAIKNRDDVVQNRFDSFRSSLHKILDKAKDEKEVYWVKVFAIGFGFGNPLSFLRGDTDKTKVRDLFELPNSDRKIVSMNDLIDDRQTYENHVEKLVKKMGGTTPMGEAFKLTEERLLYELQRNAYHPNPVIFVISDGVPTDVSSQEVKEIARRIKEMGAIIISCYVTDKNVVKAKYLFNKPDQTWDEGAKLMFECASIPPKDSELYERFYEHGWETNNHSGKLFAQINESEFLDDFMESVIRPLKN